jgi:hypothetical protein
MYEVGREANDQNSLREKDVDEWDKEESYIERIQKLLASKDQLIRYESSPR